MSATTMKTHWVADIFPLNEADIDAIADDIKANGQLVPIKAFADGTIVDGRNRWLACQKVGVEPIVEIIEAMDDGKMLNLSMSLNEKRRKTSKQQVACAAALAWKRIYPNGAPTGRPKKTDQNNLENKAVSETDGLTYQKWAKSVFDIGTDYSFKALTVLNWSPEEFAKAMASDNLADAYESYSKIKKEQKEASEKRDFISKWKDSPTGRDGNPLDVEADLIDQLSSGKIKLEQALAAARRREELKKHDEDQYKGTMESFKRRIESVGIVTELPDYQVSDFIKTYPKDVKDLIGKAKQAIARIESKMQ